mmetsp:Transcript_8051/g.8903  ORF Transcript_8051/g.8903 Transcript_8051/m.8903 type:complete len:421 (+) Transcript_8051:68-1330(+)|eukprot:CAMPEP_0194131638 /NCGR_PEP_ID=MMETSP0152-20130528/2369_1 /TAXON_ID=1049557 /ORGANISM="Thalassiothrix antarctica, Strain L6-D1" /LENGTH=420 /DNA_ID=CAMNT_0038826487 /DNA_START=68 /DNA_END=1330 /DNA_ORIENTATION=+
MSISILLLLALTTTQVLAFTPCTHPSNQRKTGQHSLSAAITLDIDFERKESYSSPERPENDLMIRAALGEDTEKTPVWLFRQAGRHLPEYKAYKDEVGRGFLEMLSYPEDVAECTMQPIRRYELDAAILFSDILVIAQALSIKVIMPGGVGIQVPEPLLDPTEVEQRIPKTSEMTPEYVQTHLGHVIQSVTLIRERMAKEGKSIPLIGFSAAPYTLLYYMVGGSSKKNTDFGMKWLKEHPVESTRLLETLTKIIVEYMSAQVEAGAHMIQVFEAMGMMIEEPEFDDFCMPCLSAIAKEMKHRYPDVPLMVFARGASFANEKLSTLGYDVITIDGSVDRSTARSTVGNNVSLQGNYDPAELIESNGKTVETVQSSAKQMLKELGPQRLIANLGEGLGGKESPELVKAFVDAIHTESEKLIQ